MKFAIVGDLHIGVKRDDPWVAAYQKKFIDFYKSECLKRGVTATIQTGDWFDVRRGLTQETMKFSREYIAPAFQEIGDTYVIVGNHDMHLREKITPNSCREVLAHFSGFHIIEEATTINLGGVNIDLIPWICRDNRESTMKFINESMSDYCVGHFELSGYYFYRGLKSEGYSPDFLKHYKEVWSGHFHCQSDGGNVRYVGTPYTLTLGDADDVRGFFIFDTDTCVLEFVENPDCWHHKVYFNADTFDLTQVKKYANKSVRLISEKRSSDKHGTDFDVATERIAAVAHDLDTVDNVEFHVEDEDDTLEIEGTADFISDYIDALDETPEDKAKMKSIINGLMIEAQDIE